MSAELLRVRRFQLGTRTTAARRQVGSREPSDASEQGGQYGRAAIVPPHLGLIQPARDHRSRKIAALDRGKRAMRHGLVDILGPLLLEAIERAPHNAETAVMHRLSRNNWSAQRDSQPMIARGILHLGRKIDPFEARIDRRGQFDFEFLKLIGAGGAIVIERRWDSKYQRDADAAAHRTALNDSR